jgi:hypothetical protein
MTMKGKKLVDTSSESSGLPSEKPAPAAVVRGAKAQGAFRMAERARKKLKSAPAEPDNASEAPNLGALNRHLNMVVQQLSAAHQVLGRVAAERDALRQQLADLQGIPVEEVEIPTIAAESETPPRQ